MILGDPPFFIRVRLGRSRKMVQHQLPNHLLPNRFAPSTSLGFCRPRSFPSEHSFPAALGDRLLRLQVGLPESTRSKNGSMTNHIGVIDQPFFTGQMETPGRFRLVSRGNRWERCFAISRPQRLLLRMPVCLFWNRCPCLCGFKGKPKKQPKPFEKTHPCQKCPKSRRWGVLNP